MTTPLGGTFGGSVIVDPRKVADLMRSPQGPVVRRMIEDGQKVKREAQRLVGVYRPPDAWSAAHRGRRPGTLRDSIVTRLVHAANSPNGLVVLVGSEDPIALLHHEGTIPHQIRPKSKPRLVFFSRKAGKVVYAKLVNHPGTKPVRYLTDALRVLG